MAEQTLERHARHAHDGHGAVYDEIGDRYSEAKTAPWRLHLEAHTLERLAGELRGARVLDLACGDGFYTRRLARRGAAAAVGVDASSEMIALAESAERTEPLGCRYKTADVNDLGVTGEFDLVVAAYLLNYARTRDELRTFCRAIHDNLRPGGRFVGVNDHTADGITGTRDFESHGFRKTGPDPYTEGAPITYEFLLPAGRSFAITNHYWHPETYVAALAEVGLTEPRWHPFELSAEGNTAFPAGTWGDLLARKPLAALTATRAR